LKRPEDSSIFANGTFASRTTIHNDKIRQVLRAAFKYNAGLLLQEVENGSEEYLRNPLPAILGHFPLGV
jgi:hypothetical protein